MANHLLMKDSDGQTFSINSDHVVVITKVKARDNVTGATGQAIGKCALITVNGMQIVVDGTVEDIHFKLRKPQGILKAIEKD